MFRPPRPPSKNIAPLAVLPLGSRQIQMGVTRFIQEQYAKSVGKNIKKTQVLVQHSEQPYHTTIQSPKYSLQIKENIQSNTNKTISVNPSGFKIRYLSSRGRRSKQNMQPNENKMNEYIMKIEMKETSTQSTARNTRSISVDARVEEQIDFMQRNQRELEFHSAKSKTGIIKLSQPTTATACIIISQSIFEQPIQTDNFMHQLKTLTHTIMLRQQSISIALKMQTNQHIPQIREIIQNNRLAIDYIIWNNQKNVSSCNVINLEKLGQVENFVIFHDTNQYTFDWYATGNLATKYCYYTGNLQQIMKAVAHLKIQQDFNNNLISVTYNKNSSVTNTTQQSLHNQHITNKIKLTQKRILVRSTSMPTCVSSTGSNSIKQFDEQYRNKLIQFAKLLMTESQQKTEQFRVNKYISNQYMKVKLKDDVAVLMDTYVGCNTAYQFVSEIVRNNSYNWKQIAEFRDKCRNFV